MIRTGEGRIALAGLRYREGRRGTNRKLLDHVMGDADLRILIEYSLEAEFGPEPVFGGGELPYRGIQDFLQWLLDNQESIIAFIKAIISLFTVNNPESIRYADPEVKTLVLASMKPDDKKRVEEVLAA